jgi:hypothetical protein
LKRNDELFCIDNVTILADVGAASRHDRGQ